MKNLPKKSKHILEQKRKNSEAKILNKKDTFTIIASNFFPGQLKRRRPKKSLSLSLSLSARQSLRFYESHFLFQKHSHKITD